MTNIWLLCEERPKESVIKTILEQFHEDKEDDSLIIEDNIKIKPRFNEHNSFDFIFDVEGIRSNIVNKIYIKIARSYSRSSFVDYLVFYQSEEPVVDDDGNNSLVYAIEETKTSDGDSRNTGVYQRCSKFVFLDLYYDNIKKIMLYNDSMIEKETISDTNIFGTRMLKSLDVKILGKVVDDDIYSPFGSVKALLDSKEKMKPPPGDNVPITIVELDDRIEVSARLSNPVEKHNIGHDPNMGAISLIASTIRKLGYDKDIVITQHGVSKEYLEKSKGNKLLRIITKPEVNATLENLTIPDLIPIKGGYWKYEESSEKMVSILVHLQANYQGIAHIYENHAGSERGFLRDAKGQEIPIPKVIGSEDIPDVAEEIKENFYDSKKRVKIPIPDLVLANRGGDSITDILLLEAKKAENVLDGLASLNSYDIFVESALKKNGYEDPSINIERYVILFGGDKDEIVELDNKVLLQLCDSGEIILNPNGPEWFKEIFSIESLIS
jgi:hypothetical protein